jgi:hypothetical protein
METLSIEERIVAREIMVETAVQRTKPEDWNWNYSKRYKDKGISTTIGNGELRLVSVGLKYFFFGPPRYVISIPSDPKVMAFTEDPRINELYLSVINHLSTQSR